MQGHARVIRAEARVDQRNEEGRIRGTVLMFIERPDHVRFDAMTQFGPAAVLTSDGARFALMDLRENRFLTGRTCPSNIARLLGIPMSAEDVALFLLGSTPVIEGAEQSIECTGDGTYLISIMGQNGRRQEVELDIRNADRLLPREEQRLRLIRSEVFLPNGDTEWRATLEDHRVIADPNSPLGLGIAMPFKVRFEHPNQGADTLVRFERIDLNVEVPAAAFEQQIPGGLVAEEVSCETTH